MHYKRTQFEGELRRQTKRDGRRRTRTQANIPHLSSAQQHPAQNAAITCSVSGYVNTLRSNTHTTSGALAISYLTQLTSPPLFATLLVPCLFIMPIPCPFPLPLPLPLLLPLPLSLPLPLPRLLPTSTRYCRCSNPVPRDAPCRILRPNPRPNSHFPSSPCP